LRLKEVIINHGREISRIDVINILTFGLSTTKERLLAELDWEIEEGTLSKIESLIRQRQKGMPLSYITGEKEFYSTLFFVDEATLIPRPETELLVDEAIDIIKKRPSPVMVLDIGTGSGAIGLTIAKMTGAKTLCIDISYKALVCAKRNAHRLSLIHKTNLLCSDLFQAIKEGTMFDIITVNLPYVSDSEWGQLMPDVKGFEPKEALLGGIDGMGIYRRFMKGVERFMKEDGHLLCEIGSKAQAEEMVKTLSRKGIRAYTKKDLSGRERLVVGNWTSL
jgi:release factor glutamine methyltransferase